MKTSLSTIDFTSDIARLTENFMGRQWVFGVIDCWLQESKEKFFILTGEPGVGKSAIAARLTQIRDDIVAHHFCRAGDVETVRPGRVLRSLAAQMGEHLPDYGQALANTIKPVHLRVEVNINIGSMTGSQVTGVYIENLKESDPANELDILIRAPLTELQKMYVKRQQPQPNLAIILIDSLDEAVTTTGTNLVELLTQLSKSNSLPPWVKFILTSRPERRVLRGFEPLKPYHLRETSDESLRDIRTYIEYRVELPVLQDLLQVKQVQKALINEITALSKGNFLYTKLLLNDIEAGRQALDNLAELPKSIDEIYHGFLCRFSEDDWRDSYKPILGILTVAKEPLSEKEISTFTNIDPEEVRDSIRIARQFFDIDINKQGKETYAIFHQSFREYLLDENRNSDFWCNALKYHQRIFDCYWLFYPNQWGNCGLYGLKHLAAHLADLATISNEIGYVDKLSELLLTFDWLQAKLNATTINALLADYDKLPHGTEVRSVQDAKLLQRACRLSSDVLARDKSQLAGQLVARIPEHQKQLREQILEQSIANGKTWLRPLTSSLAAEQSFRWFRAADGDDLDCVVFSSNGIWAAYVADIFGGTPRDVILWNLKDWQSYGPQFHTLARRNPFAMALSDDGQWCLYADSIGCVHRLSAQGSAAWEGHAHRDLTIAHLLVISADGQRALSACQHGRLVAWDIGADCYEIIWDESNNYIRALTLDAAGMSAVVARADGSITLLELWPTREQILFKLDGEPSAIARSQDKTIVAAATIDGHIEARTVSVPEPLISAITTSGKPTSMAISPCKKYLAVGTDKGALEVWNIADRKLSARYSHAHTYGVKCVGFSYEGTSVVSAGSHHIKEWALKANEEEVVRRAMGAVKVTANGQHALAVLEDGCLGVWNIRSGSLESALPRPSGHAFGDSDIGRPDGITLASHSARVTAWNRNLLCVWDLEVGDSVRSLSTKDTRDAVITPDGTGVVYVSGYDISLWKPDVAEVYVLGRYHGDPPGYVAVSSDGQRAVSSGGAREVILWQLDNSTSTEFVAMEQLRCKQIALGMRPSSWAEITSYWAENNWAKITSIEIDSRDKPATVVFIETNNVIVTTGDGSMFTCDISKPANTEARIFTGKHSAFVSKLLVTNDNNFAVTSSGDCTIRIWDLHTHQCVKAFNTHPGTIERISAEGDRALLWTFDGVLKIISLHEGKLLAAFEGDKKIYTCDADSELEWVVACDEGGQMHFLHFENGLIQ